MRVVSVNVAPPREVSWQGGTVTTGIFKQPVVGRVKVRRFNLEGDRQADLSVHGGPTKAVYTFPASTTHIGASNSRILTCPGGCSVRTSLLKALSKTK